MLLLWRKNNSHLSKHETSTQCWTNIGPPSTTLAQHWSNIGSMSRACWDIPWFGNQKVEIITRISRAYTTWATSKRTRIRWWSRLWEDHKSAGIRCLSGGWEAGRQLDGIPTTTTQNRYSMIICSIEGERLRRWSFIELAFDQASVGWSVAYTMAGDYPGDISHYT